MDSNRGSEQSDRADAESGQFGRPYARTIAYFKLILTKKMAPIDKLFSLQQGWQILFEEIREYQTLLGNGRVEHVGQEQRDYILRYVLI